jgi:hypothetical protein
MPHPIRIIVGVLIASSVLNTFMISSSTHYLRNEDDSGDEITFAKDDFEDIVSNDNRGIHLPPPSSGNTRKPDTVKIVAFTDHSFAPIGQWWYQKMKDLSYTTQTLVLFEPMAVAHFDKLRQKGHHFQTDVQLIDQPVAKRRFKVHRLWYMRILYCLNQLKSGQSLVLTDSDNVFLRYVPLDTFEQSGYDAIFSFEQRYPEHIFKQQGFVLCGGMTYLKATNATIQIMERLLYNCFNGDGREGRGSKSCDDQVVWNQMLFKEMKWDMNNTRSQKIDGNASTNDLLQHGFEGHSAVVPNFHAMIWDRKFSHRGRFEECPFDDKAWVSMPNPLKDERLEKIVRGRHGRFAQQYGLDELSMVLIWEKFCAINGTDVNQRLDEAVSFYMENFKELVSPFVNDTRGNL